MANKPREQVQREMELIRRLSEHDNLSDNEIIEQLQISVPTFYRYKARIRKQYIKAWEKQNTDRAEYTYNKFHDTLEYCYRANKKIVDNPHSKPMEIIEATKTMDVIAAQMAKLARDGPIFKPQLQLPTDKVIEIENRETT